uniref:Uncharacterized protein n=1 Tax=Cacopsylla melanoneura TaxID=428564 RepID=A0A8D8SRX7_9HEMI
MMSNVRVLIKCLIIILGLNDFVLSYLIEGVGWDLSRDGDTEKYPVSVHNETVTGDYTVTTWQWKDPDGGIWDTRLKMSFKGGINGGGMIYRNAYGVECIWLRWVMRDNVTWKAGSTSVFPTTSWTVTTFFDMTWSYVPTHDGSWFFHLNNMTFEPKIGGITMSPMETHHQGHQPDHGDKDNTNNDTPDQGNRGRRYNNQDNRDQRYNIQDQEYRDHRYNNQDQDNQDRRYNKQDQGHRNHRYNNPDLQYSQGYEENKGYGQDRRQGRRWQNK